MYVDVERAFTERIKPLLTNAPNPRKRWSTVKTAVFDVSSSFPPLLDRGGRPVWSVDEKASLFSAHFAAKQCTDSLQQLYSCDPCPVFCSVAFRPTLFAVCFWIWILIIEMILMKVPTFFKQLARELAPKLAVIFRHRVTGW